MAVNQIAIDQLRLDEAFTGKMLHRAFNECWTVKCDELLLIVDDDKSQTSRFGDENDNRDKALAVINENRREIVLLSIDNQLLKAIEGGVADCALFDDKQFRFVEFKTNAEGKNLDTKYEKQLNAYICAFESIKNLSADAKTYHIDV